MTAEQNKIIIYQLFDCINNKDWEQLDKLIHKDFGEKRPNDGFEGLTGVQADEITYEEENPFMAFIKLIQLSEAKISKWKELLKQSNSKQGFLEERQFASDILVNWEIKDIIADEDRVWVLRDCIFKDPNQRNIKLSSFILLRIKEKQIISFITSGRYYNSLIQYGRIVMARNKVEEVEKYIQTLKNVGIIPQLTTK